MDTVLFFPFIFQRNSRWKRFFINVLCFLVVLLLFAQPTTSSSFCKPAKCGSSGPPIRFPFRLKGRQSVHCGYLGFDLSCNNQNQTVLNLPQSGEFILDHIDYIEQAISIKDPDLCLPKRILNFNLSGSPFHASYTRNYTFLNCSSDWNDNASFQFVPLLCLSGKNHSVFAMNLNSSDQGVPATCRRIMNVSIPQYQQFVELRLIWNEPGCEDCESRGGMCGFKSENGSDIGCSSPPNSGLPRIAKYGIIIGIGIPGLVCMLGLACHTCSQIWTFSLRQHENSELPTISQQPVVRVSGLDGPIIDSYPKTMLGESRRLPNPNDDTCPICLAEYQPKEILKTIPECNHYFHSACIDEWLMLNATCHVCRTSP
ncbi:RING-H2 finger ATL21A [Olea europaea subsp. europaea]|uniref:RING-type E3 ubiquitin transferase n=1 Tax=Olea europaea subsp. europaea TaxID=158383 RepID=A0A8S0RNH5_OLEEU|nr:RING-H2 finger ATL21A [Olea europaea subsp. europaea]